MRRRPRPARARLSPRCSPPRGESRGLSERAGAWQLSSRRTPTIHPRRIPCMAQRPNLLFIVTDQHRADHTGFGGNEVLRTPNLDRIAARGVRFERALVANPICMPNRSSIATGRLPSVHGTRTNGTPLDSGGHPDPPPGPEERAAFRGEVAPGLEDTRAGGALLDELHHAAHRRVSGAARAGARVTLARVLLLPRSAPPLHAAREVFRDVRPGEDPPARDVRRRARGVGAAPAAHDRASRRA